jgi:hypothetical protein
MAQTQGPDQESSYSTPRWVKVAGIIMLILIVLIGILLMTGNHGPGRHMQSISTDDRPLPLEDSVY